MPKKLPGGKGREICRTLTRRNRSRAENLCERFYEEGDDAGTEKALQSTKGLRQQQIGYAEMDIQQKKNHTERL